MVGLDRGWVAARFSSAAAGYERRSGIHRKAARKVLRLLEGVATPDRILEVGCGTGILTEGLRSLFPESKVVGVDVSAGMIERAACKTGFSDRVSFVVADLLEFEAVPFPLAVSSCALHWVRPLEAAFERLSRLVGRGGRLVFAIMIEGTLAELHTVRRRAVPAKPPRAGLPTADSVLRGLTGAGFRVEKRGEDSFRTRHGSAREFLRYIHSLGVTGGDLSSGGRFLTRGELECLCRLYDREFKAEGGGIEASWRVLYVSALRE